VTALSAEDLPQRLPAGLRLSSIDVVWWRLDTDPPEAWSWQPYPTLRGRFDPDPGVARVRYAARTLRGAFRERYADTRRVIYAHEAGTHVVRLTGRVRVLDLRNESVLDVLGVDDEISTGRDPRVLQATRVLCARLVSWYGPRLHGIVYRSRTTPASSVNLAFFAAAPVQVERAGAVADYKAMLVALIADDAFRVELPGWA
jgi:hypothetical protein